MSGLLVAHFDCKNSTSPELEGLRAPAVIEDGQTYFENALKKALAYYSVFRMPVLADDSGVEVDALSGAPGVHSAYYGGESLTWADRWAALHKALAGVPSKDWTARFRCVLCFYDGKSVPLFAQGVCEGKLLARPVGSNGFGYDPIFFSSLLGKGFGEASDSEKAKASHRAAAVREFLDRAGSGGYLNNLSD